MLTSILDFDRLQDDSTTNKTFLKIGMDCCVFQDFALYSKNGGDAHQEPDTTDMLLCTKNITGFRSFPFTMCKFFYSVINPLMCRVVHPRDTMIAKKEIQCKY